MKIFLQNTNIFLQGFLFWAEAKEKFLVDISGLYKVPYFLSLGRKWGKQEKGKKNKGILGKTKGIGNWKQWWLHKDFCKLFKLGMGSAFKIYMEQYSPHY